MRFLAGKPKKREHLVPQGFSSLRLLVVPWVSVIPKLDVAGSTPVARSNVLSLPAPALIATRLANAG